MTAPKGRHQPEQNFEFIDNVSWIKAAHRSRSALTSGSTITTRSATSSRAAGSSSTAGQRVVERHGGHRALVCRLPARLPASFRVVGSVGVTEFRAISQNYYITDTWRMRDNMTLDLGLRYERPAVRGQSRHVDQPPHAVLRPGAARGRHVAASNAGAHRRRGVLREFQHPLQSGDSDGT